MGGGGHLLLTLEIPPQGDVTIPVSRYFSVPQGKAQFNWISEFKENKQLGSFLSFLSSWE